MSAPFRIAMLALLLAIFLASLGAPGFWEKDEGRYAQAAREMRRSGDFLVPTLRGQPRLNKPPLFYWAIAGSQAALGENEFASRLPSALAGFAAALVVFLLTRRLAGETAGWFAAVVYATTIYGAGMGRLAHPESFLSLAVSSSLLCFFTAYRDGFRNKKLLALAWLCAGLGFLAKGPHGILLPVLVMCVYLLARKDGPSIRRMMFGRGLLIALAPVACWGGLVVAEKGLGIVDHWVAETFGRMAGTEDFHKEPVWFFLPVLIAGFLPWTLWLPVVVQRFRARGSRPAGGRFLLVWVGVIFVFFSIGTNKAASYMLSAMPPLAIATGIALARLENSRALRTVGILHAVVVVAAGIALAVWGLPPSVALFRTEAILFGAAALLGALAISTAALTGKPRIVAFISPSCTVPILLIGVTLVAPGMNPLHSVRNAGLAIHRAHQEGDLVVNLGTKRAGLAWYADLPINRDYEPRDMKELWDQPRRVLAFGKWKWIPRLTESGRQVHILWSHPSRKYIVYSNRNGPGR